MSLSKRLAGNSNKRSANNQYIEPLIPGRPAFSTNAGVVVDSETAIRMSTGNELTVSANRRTQE